jgi:CHRD domain-containing protein
MSKASTSRLLLAFLLLVLVAVPALAASGGSNKLSADLTSYQEVPALQSNATGHLDIEIDGNTVHYTLTFSNLRADATQSHIHMGQPGVNGGVFVFFCSNLGNGPAGTPACPLRGGTLTGTFGASNILAINAQGIGAGDISSVLKALRNGVTYANVHSTLFPGGEIRGQIKAKGKLIDLGDGLGLDAEGEDP